MKQTIFGLIKVASTILISGAIALEAWNLTMGIDWAMLPGWCHGAFWYARGAAAIHLLEGIVAAVWITKNSETFPTHQPLFYGVYTFFIGTVGLQELWETQKKTV